MVLVGIKHHKNNEIFVARYSIIMRACILCAKMNTIDQEWTVPQVSIMIIYNRTWSILIQ